MRGPGLRLDLDVRRLWTCPVCRSQRRLGGNIVAPLCPCREGGVLMHLTKDAPLLRRAERVTPLPFEKRVPPANRTASPPETDRSDEPQSDGPRSDEPRSEEPRSENRSEEETAVRPRPNPDPVPEPGPVPTPVPIPDPVPNPLPEPGPVPFPDPVPGPRAETEPNDDFGADLV